MTKPKVGILSMQRIQNYGSFLQAWGLRAMLEELGAEVEFVDYQPGPCLVINEGNASIGVRRKFEKVSEVLLYDAPLRDRLGFIRYKSNYGRRYYPMLGLSKQPNYNPRLDMLVIGSDEVFNCIQANVNVGYTSALFGQGIQAKRKISYAASFGNTKLSSLNDYQKANEVGEWLASLDAISVRDNNSASIVHSLTGKTPYVHLDPVLTYEFLEKSKGKLVDIKIRKPYMILYGYSGRFTRAECAAVRKYAENRKLRVINIGGVQECCDCFLDANPFEIINLFVHAESVVTDTFHGTILAIITERPFASIVRDSKYGNSQKLGDLLTRLDLDSRAIEYDSLTTALKDPINWKPVREKIATGRASTKEYLSKQLMLCAESVR